MAMHLSKFEVAICAHCGCTRNIEGYHLPDKYGFNEEFGWNVHIEGACAEYACAKCLGRHWEPTVNVFKAPDIGMTIGVRRRSRHDYDLLIRPDDNPDYAYMLVTGKAPDFAVRGWCMGRDAQRQEWLKEYGDRPLAWFVPQAALRSWKDLVYRPPSLPRRPLLPPRPLLREVK